jgi:hypothetical protein
VVGDTDVDGVVEVGHDQGAFGDDTGSMAFQARRDGPRAYLPVDTDAGGALPVHAYLTQGAFGTEPGSVGELRSAGWTHPDADEDGLRRQ